MRQFDSMLRQGLMDANLAQYERALQSAESGEIDFSPRYLRESGQRSTPFPRFYPGQR